MFPCYTPFALGFRRLTSSTMLSGLPCRLAEGWEWLMRDWKIGREKDPTHSLPSSLYCYQGLSLDAPPELLLHLTPLTPLQSLPSLSCWHPFRLQTLMSPTTFPSHHAPPLALRRLVNSTLEESPVFCSSALLTPTAVLDYPIGFPPASLHAGSYVSNGSSITVRALPTKPAFTFYLPFKTLQWFPKARRIKSNF